MAMLFRSVGLILPAPSPSATSAPSSSAPRSAATSTSSSPTLPPTAVRPLHPPVHRYTLYPCAKAAQPLQFDSCFVPRTLDDDALLIPAGSDLVVKRVPIASSGGSGGESSNPHKRVEEQHGCARSDQGEGIASLLSPLDKFDDPSNVLCPGLEAELPESCTDSVKPEQSSNKRCSEMSCASARYLNIEGSGLSEVMPKEIVVDNSTEELDLEDGKREIKTNSKARECEKMEQNVAKSSQVIPNMDVPTELRCFLCKTLEFWITTIGESTASHTRMGFVPFNHITTL